MSLENETALREASQASAERVYFRVNPTINKAVKNAFSYAYRRAWRKQEEEIVKLSKQLEVLRAFAMDIYNDYVYSEAQGLGYHLVKHNLIDDKLVPREDLKAIRAKLVEE